MGRWCRPSHPFTDPGRAIWARATLRSGPWKALAFEHPVLACDLEHPDMERFADCRGDIERAAHKRSGHDDGVLRVGPDLDPAEDLAVHGVNVGPGGVRGLSLQVGGDKRAPQFVPDKSGKPRQSHIGY